MKLRWLLIYAGPSLLLCFVAGLVATAGNERPCAENICQNGGVCLRPATVAAGSASFRCECRADFSGTLCESVGGAASIVVADATCERPCANGGKCVRSGWGDEICECENGYYGDRCEQTDCEVVSCAVGEICLFDPAESRFACEVDLCALRQPCRSNVTCRPAKGDYFCECPPGVGGKDCETPMSDAACARCQNGADCVRIDASRTRCECAPGFAGDSCEDFIGYCHEAPCGGRGICRELPAGYACSCFPPYRGVNCEVSEDSRNEMSDCGTHGKLARLTNGAVSCICDNGYAGERCELSDVNTSERFPLSSETLTTIFTTSTKVTDTTTVASSVTLPTCETLRCATGEICRQRAHAGAECDCPPGRMGVGCAAPSAASLGVDAAALVDRRHTSGSSAAADYQLAFTFRTTAADAALAGGESIFGVEEFALALADGRLRMNFSGAPSVDLSDAGVLNDAQWHRLLFSNTARDGCVLELEDDAAGVVTWRRSLGVVRPLESVFSTRFGGKGDRRASFVGCLRDVKIDDERVDLLAQTRSVGLKPGCNRVVQCPAEEEDGDNNAAGQDLARCANGGRCVDLWTAFRCECRRPFLGPRCVGAVAEVTFGHERRASAAEFALSAEDAALARDTTDISLFLRTNAAPAPIFYFGEAATTVDDAAPTHYMEAQIADDGTLLITVSFGAHQPLANRTVERLNDNRRHFVRVVRSLSNVTVFVDYEQGAQIALGRTAHATLAAETFVLGARPGRSDEFLRGTVQDVRVNERLVAISGADNEPLSLVGTVDDLPTFGRQTRAFNLLQGTVSDDICAEMRPCQNGGRCVNTFNDFQCECAVGWIGVRCDKRDHCAAAPCRRDGAMCTNVYGGYVCLAPATFASTSFATFVLPSMSEDESTLETPWNMTMALRTRSDLSVAVLRLKAGDSQTLCIDLRKDGRLHFNYHNASGGRIEATSPMFLADGDWHTLVLSDSASAGASLSITADSSKAVILPLPVTLKQLARQANVSLSFGRDDDAEMDSFKGCIQNFRLGPLPPLSFFDGTEGVGGFENASITPAVLTRSENVRVGHCRSDRVCFENSANECRNGAACRDTFNARRCDCPPGFSGDLCEVNVDDCAPDTGQPSDAKCGPNGVCVDGIANYTCACLSGFTGARCEIPPADECTTRYRAACLNGGKCEHDVDTGEYRCACAANFIGRYCQTTKNTKCFRAPCKNGAKCIQNEDGGFSCACPDGFTGALCDEETNASDPCRQRPCHNGGRCASTPTGASTRQRGAVAFPRYEPNEFTCECRTDFAGARCERFADACAAGGGCQNGARCENVFGGRVCRCTAGWSGADCATDVDECVESAPCRNGARCHNTAGGYKCDCGPFYFGDRCEVRGACARQPCQNGAVCEQLSAERHVCHCAPGYRGEACEKEIDFCAPGPCLNGGSCHRIIAGFECDCAPGFIGPTCATDIDECALAPGACANNGTCIDRVNAFECDCTGTGYRGPQCLDDIDECAAEPWSVRQRRQNEDNEEDDQGHSRHDEHGHEEHDNNMTTVVKPHIKANTSSMISSAACVHGVCTNLPGSYRCDCEPGYIGERCHMANPCLPDPRTQRILHACTHGKCVHPTIVRQASGREVTQHDCDCEPGYGGAQCTFLEQARKPLAIGFILGPFAILLIILCAFGTMLFLLVVRKKRATQGTYSPSTQEMMGAIRPTIPLQAHHGGLTGTMTEKTTTTPKRISPKSHKSTCSSISVNLTNDGF